MNEDEQEKKLEQELREGLNEPQEQDQQTAATETKPEPASISTQPQHNSPGIVILQWLSYAFWAWLVVGLIWLISLTLASTILDEDVSSTIPYALAASIVLLPVAFFVDLFYRKYEPIKKQGASMVIMVIHAVIYALITIGTLIGAVFILLNMLINDSFVFDSAASVALYATTFASLAFGFVFVRVLNPFKTKRFTKLFAFVMLGISAALIVLGFICPAMGAFNLRNDRLIEAGIGPIATTVGTYVSDNDTLPKSLSDLTFSDDSADSLVEKGLVTYKPEGKFTPASDDEIEINKGYEQYRYQLCVTYAKASTYQNRGYDGVTSSPEIYPYPGDDEYQTYPDSYSHPAGKVCYKLAAYIYDYDDVIPL
jgi:hypothetical protein